MSENTIVNILWAVVALFIVREIGAYATAQLFITGKPLLRRREPVEEPSRIHRAS